MTIYEMIEEITERYIIPKDDSGRTELLLKKDFGFYSPGKLDKVWYAIKRYHRANFAPNYSAIIDCMDKAGIGESSEQNQEWYQRCIKCGAKYSMNTCCCPKCNKYLAIGDNYMNEVEIVKCQTLPHDVIVTRQACPICPIFRGSTTYPRGIKCESFQGDMRGQIPDCDNCKCKECCLDLGGKNEDMESGTFEELRPPLGVNSPRQRRM